MKLGDPKTYCFYLLCVQGMRMSHASDNALSIHTCLMCTAVQSATEQLDHMAVDDRPSALTPPVLDSSASGAPQPAQPPPASSPAGDTALPAAQADGSELTSEQQSVVTALAEMDSRSSGMPLHHLQCSAQDPCANIMWMAIALAGSVAASPI